MSNDDSPLETVQFPDPYQHKPWKPGMSRRFTHRWLATQYPRDEKTVRISPSYLAADQTCANCGLRRLRGVELAGGPPGPRGEPQIEKVLGRWQYKRPSWAKWRTKADFCALRPDAPPEPRKYERRTPRGYRPR